MTYNQVKELAAPDLKSLSDALAWWYTQGWTILGSYTYEGGRYIQYIAR